MPRDFQGCVHKTEWLSLYCGRLFGTGVVAAVVAVAAVAVAVAAVAASSMRRFLLLLGMSSCDPLLAILARTDGGLVCDQIGLPQ